MDSELTKLFEVLFQKINTIIANNPNNVEKSRLKTYFIVLFQSILNNDSKTFYDMLDTIDELVSVPDVKFEKIQE